MNDTKLDNSSFDPDGIYHTAFYITDVFTFIVTICSCIVDILMMCTIMRYKILRTSTYFYIANWCICNFFLVAPAIFQFTGTFYEEQTSIVCICRDSAIVFMLGGALFISILIIDWYIKTFSNQTKCAIYGRLHFKLIIAVVWIVLIIYLIVTIVECFVQIHLSLPLTFLTFVFAYIGVFVLIAVIFILRLFKLHTSSTIYEKSKLELIIVFAYFACGLPNLIYLFIYLYNIRSHSAVTEKLVQLTHTLGYASACIIFVLLFSYDKKFKNCIKMSVGLKITNNENHSQQDIQNTLILT